MLRRTHFHWEGHARKWPESRPNIRPRRLQQPKPARIGNRGVASSSTRALQRVCAVSPSKSKPGEPRVSLQAKGDRIVLSVRDAGVGLPIPFARPFARVTARPQTAIDPIKIPPRWKNISSAPPGGRAPSPNRLVTPCGYESGPNRRARFQWLHPSKRVHSKPASRLVFGSPKLTLPAGKPSAA